MTSLYANIVETQAQWGNKTMWLLIKQSSYCKKWVSHQQMDEDVSYPPWEAKEDTQH